LAHQEFPTDQQKALADRQRFIRTQSIKGGLGIVLSLGYLVLIGGPDLAEGLAFLGLFAPIALALAARLNIKLELLEAASLAAFALLIALLSALTSGAASPFICWLVLVPFEGALAGRARAVAFSGIAAALSLIAVVAIQAADMLPETRLPGFEPLWFGMSLLVAVVQATLMAIAAQERHREADEAAEAGEARYRFLAENALDLITRHTRDGRIRYASPSALTLLFYRPRDLMGQSFADLAHPEDRPGIEKAFSAAGEGNAATVELRLKTRRGTYVWSEFRCRPSGRSNDKHGDIVAVTRDITERKAHERDLIHARDLAEDASRAKSRFLANMSHELRTPLNAILGFSEVMTHELFGPVGNSRYLEYAHLIHESGGHLLEVINSILDMSKIEAGRFKLTPERFDLADTVRQSLRLVKFQAERNAVTLEEAVEPNAREIVADKRAIVQILINLISNGVKYTQRGGTVRVGAALRGSSVEIAVSDTGVGIGEADLKRLGEPFERVDSEYTRTKEGTGLGLALVRALTQLHGGTMRMESVLGEGTTVRILIPGATAPEIGSQKSETRNQKPDIGSQKSESAIAG